MTRSSLRVQGSDDGFEDERIGVIKKVVIKNAQERQSDNPRLSDSLTS